jgi:hypothetical protein
MADKLEVTLMTIEHAEKVLLIASLQLKNPELNYHTNDS